MPPKSTSSNPQWSADKVGPLANPADRDHCIQYMVAVPLIFGYLTAADYEDDVASDPRIDALRAKMTVAENTRFTAEYYAADKRYIGNALQIFFDDGTSTDRVAIDYPVGHRLRRDEGIPLLLEKFEHAVRGHFDPGQADRITSMCQAGPELDTMSVNQFVDTLSVGG